MKLFSDVFYLDGKHILAVKTWEKVVFKCKLKNSSNPVSLEKLIENRKAMAEWKPDRLHEGKQVIEKFNELV